MEIIVKPGENSPEGERLVEIGQKPEKQDSSTDAKDVLNTAAHPLRTQLPETDFTQEPHTLYAESGEVVDIQLGGVTIKAPARVTLPEKMKYSLSPPNKVSSKDN